MKRPTLGDQELELLRFITDIATPMSVRQLVQKYGEPRGLARTTILTMCERLRKKEYLTRQDIRGVNFYSSLVDKDELLKDIIHDFVEKKLNGSLSPFAAYLTQTTEVSEQELQEFKKLVKELETGRGENE